MKKQAGDRYGKEKACFRKAGGILRTGAAIRKGIHPRVLYAMRDTGIIERIGRGIYRLKGLPSLRNPDLVSVAARMPRAVICLISALSYYEITTQVPREVHIAIEQGSRPLTFDFPPVRYFWFSGEVYAKGIQKDEIDGITVKIYSPEKTIADCFKFRNKIGLDVALEALNLYRNKGRFDVTRLVHFARICRVRNVMRPYLEALV